MNPALFKLGKDAPKIDRRTLLVDDLYIAKDLPPIPQVYDFDAAHPGAPLPMFANDVHGDCVLAGRAHMTLRMEFIEQNAWLKITDAQVLAEYFKESGGADNGLVMLDSLNAWRRGWKAAGQTYTIDAYAAVTPKKHASVQAAIYLLDGIYTGFALPISAQAQVGKVWDVVAGARGKPGSWGGHCVYVPAWNATGPVCVTWGKRQQMTWAFWDKYCDESYAIVDNLDAWRAKPGIDVKSLEAYLQQIKG